jgi:hypothetical protein
MEDYRHRVTTRSRPGTLEGRTGIVKIIHMDRLDLLNGYTRKGSSQQEYALT